MRAVADDQQAALSLGVSIRKIFAVAWGIALMSAVAAGVIVGSITNLSTDGLASIGILVFPAVIVGGLDSLPGAVIGGLIEIGLQAARETFQLGRPRLGLHRLLPRQGQLPLQGLDPLIHHRQPIAQDDAHGDYV